MFTRFYPNQPESQAIDFSSKTTQSGKNVSAAQVQGLFLKFKDNPDKALANISFLWSS